MGRAFSVREASIKKNGAARGKLYSMYSKEIYQAGKNGGTDIKANYVLRRLVEKAKADQVPNDIINRAIDRVNSGADETYVSARYEMFGPAGSTIVVDCLTDNINRTVSAMRSVTNKGKFKLGAMGSVAYMYDNLCIVAAKGLNEEAVLDAMINANIEVDDIETSDDELIVYGKPVDLYEIKNVLEQLKPGLTFDTDEIAMVAKSTVKLDDEDMISFQKTLNLLDEVEDVQKVYHNVEMEENAN